MAEAITLENLDEKFAILALTGSPNTLVRTAKSEGAKKRRYMKPLSRQEQRLRRERKKMCEQRFIKKQRFAVRQAERRLSPRIKVLWQHYKLNNVKNKRLCDVWNGRRPQNFDYVDLSKKFQNCW